MKNRLWMLLVAALAAPSAQAAPQSGPAIPKAAQGADPAPAASPINTHTVQGIVTYGPTGKPAAKVQVLLILHEEVGIRGMGATTDAKGRFQLLGLSPGSYSCSTGPSDDRALGPKAWVSPLQWTDIKPGDQVVKLRIVLSHVVRVMGTVTDTASGRPLPGIEVNVYPDDGDTQSTESDAHGHYQVYALSGSMMVMAVDPTDITHSEQKTVQVTAGTTRVVDLHTIAPPSSQ